MPNDRVLELFRSALSKIKEFEYFDMLSLVATNLVKEGIGGADYLIFDTVPLVPLHEIDFAGKITELLSGILEITDMVRLSQLYTTSINQFAYYMADLSRISVPQSLFANLTAIWGHFFKNKSRNTPITPQWQNKNLVIYQCL